MKESDIKLLEKFLDGLCTNEELMLVESLLLNEDARQMLDNIMEKRELFRWNNPKEPDDKMRKAMMRAKRAVKRKIANNEGHNSPFRQYRLITWASIAAVFLGLIVFTTLYVKQTNQNIDVFAKANIRYKELNNSEGVPTVFMLPDSTKLYLAAGSTLKYPEVFGANGRHVELTGEAFFDVKPDKNRPFIIHSGDLETMVLGTSFKITAFDGLEQEISVATGKVSVKSIHEKDKSKSVLLTRGNQVKYNPESGNIAKGSVNVQDLENWKLGMFVINNQPLSLVVKQLEGRYKLHFSFSDERIATNRVSATFSADESAESILEMLGFVGKFEYETRDTKNYIIHPLNYEKMINS